MAFFAQSLYNLIVIIINTKTKMVKTILKGIAGLVAVAAVTVAVLFLISPSLEETADSILSELKSGNHEEVYNNSSFVNNSFKQFKDLMGIGYEDDLSTAERIAWTDQGKDYHYYIVGDFKYVNGETNSRRLWFEKRGFKYILNGVSASN